MVAVVSGSGLGLFNSSASSLGGAGTNGNPVVGRGRDRVYVNSSTGNLIVQSVDETLAALGLDFAGVRTYNSQGLADEDNNDQWRLGVQQRIYKLTGTVNTSGSTVTKVFGDGAEIVYTWNTTRLRYESGAGDGANDYLTWDGATSRWTWTDGSARTQEEYGLVDGVQRIRLSRDADGNSITYNYDDLVNLKLLTSVTMVNPTGLPANAQTVKFTYTGKNLTGIEVTSGGAVQTLTRYGYDSLNRLQTVTVDLTPGDNSVADNITYTTTYGYEGSSTRISSITQKDGSSVGFQYQLINGEYRLWTATDAEGRTTTFTYSTVAGTAITSTAVNGAQLTTSGAVNVPPLAGALTASPAGWNNAAVRDTSTSTVADPRMAFDANGNGFLVWRVSSNVVAQRYTRATNSWGPEVILDNRTQTATLPSLSMDAAGNAIVAWVQSDTFANSIYGARYDAATGVWTQFTNPIDTNAADPNLTDTSFPVNTGTYTLVTAINGTRAVVAWQHNQAATGSVYNLYAARLNGTTWAPAESLETLAATAGQQSVAIDDQGNIAVAFQQSDGTALNIYVNRFTASTTTWSGAAVRDTAPTSGASDPRIAFDANGNGILLYRVGSNVFAQRYTRTGNSWSGDSTLDALGTNATALQLAIDANGTGIAAWVQADASGASVYAARFNGTTWSAAVPIDAPAATLNTPVNANAYTMTVSVAGNRAAIVWQQNQTATGTVYDVYAARFDGTTWSAAELVEQRADNALQPVVAIDALGNVTAAFQQNDGAAVSALVARYNVSAASSYYVVPAGATWQSIANAVYGSNTAAAGAELALRMAPQTLATNVQLGGFPATLAVPAPGAPSYYQVVSGDTWSIVTNKLYGTTDANAIAALQAYCGTTTLAVSGRLYVPETLKFQAVGTTAAVYRTTVAQNSLLVPTTYSQDTQGRLTSALVAGIETRFAYDSTTGNVSSITEDPTGLNRITTFSYDSVTGLLRWTRDNLGNSTQRTYNANNQLLTEVLYTGPDPDAINTGSSPTGAMTTRYAYDSENHLRFAISADGRVTEHQYNAAGQRVLTFNHLAAAYGAASPFTETDLQTWAAGTGAGVRERIDYAYDWRGNLQTLTRWATTTPAGAGSAPSSVTQFVYDQRGQLLQTIDPRGSATAPNPLNPNQNQAYSRTYVYDGLGRVKAAVEWLKPLDADGPLDTRTTTTLYDDVGRQTTVTLDNTLASVSSYNRAGELISVSNGTLGTTNYFYDAMGRLRIVKDPTGVRQFSFYDDAGRLTGTVDGDGTLTESIYSQTSQGIKTVRYSVLLSSSRIASLFDAGTGTPTAVTLATLRGEAGTNPNSDQVSRNVYDGTGRLVYKIETIGFDTTLNVPIDAVTKFVYDGANRLVEEVQYKTTISIARATDQVLPTAIVTSDSTEDRRTRHFYDNSGNRIATLDGAGYLTEFTYDNAGHLIIKFERANPVDVSFRLAGTLAQLQASAGFDSPPPATQDTDSEWDIATYYYYDMQGRLSATLDGEGYYTKTNYDVAGNAISTVRYDRRLTYTSRPLQSTVETDILGATSHTQASEYDGAGRLIREINYQGTATKYEYDGMDNVLSVRAAQGDALDERWTETRYDLLGRVTQELTAEGKALIVALGTTPAPSAVEDIWTRFGVLYAYDKGGRRTSATAKPNDTQTNVTRYFYDNDNRLRFEVNQLGERKEYVYNALGQFTDEIRYFNRIAAGGLTGGLLSELPPSTLTTLISLPDATRDAKTSYAYSLRGQQISSLTIEGGKITQAYNTFGESASRTVGNTGEGVVFGYTYTTRGQLKDTIRDGVTIEAREYDAFGRLNKVTNARGKITKTEYDRLGRVIATVDALNGRSTVSYDGYSRVKETFDATSTVNKTSFTYDDALLTTTMVTPENITVKTTETRHVETRSVVVSSVADGTVSSKSYTYDKNGQLLTVTDGGQLVETNVYDRGGRLTDVTDARGIKTTIDYDAANRTFTRTVDTPTTQTPTGNLLLKTTYVYDGEGRVTDVTDPRNILTRTSYDRDGRVTDVAVDPSGLNLRTHYTYNTRNDTVTVTEMYGTLLPRVTQYLFDSAGRRKEEIVDPSGLNLRTQYKYDAADNVSRVIDSRGFSCWYVYDDKNRLTHKIDALGGLTVMTYDAVDRVASTRHFVTVISDLSALVSNDLPTTTNFAIPAQSANDRFERTFYDKDGREKYSIDGLGVVTQRDYDAAGNVTLQRVYSVPRLTGSFPTTADVAGALSTSALDRVTRNVYDSRGRLEYSIESIDGTNGSVTSFYYDENGNVLEVQKYAATRALNLANDITTLRNWRSANQSAPNDQLTRFWYDRADRQRFIFSAEGALTETSYNDLNRTTTSVAYKQPQTAIAALGSSSTAAQVAQARVFDATYDQTTIAWADAAGRARLTLDAEGYLTETRYNDNTGATSTTLYAETPLPAPDATTALATAAGYARTTPTRDRTSMTWVDAAGRERFTVDGEGYTVETRYDDVSGTKRIIRYAQPYTAGALTIASTLPTANGILTALTDSEEQRTRTDYDNVGRISRITEGETSSIAATEYYGYDGAGNKTKFTNARGSALGEAAFTWDYTYDANGNLLTEVTPFVDVSSVTADASSITVSNAVSQRITTKFVYDHLGNVTEKHEAFGTAQVRVTSFQYDSLGRQVRTYFPVVPVYNPATGDTDYGTAGVITASANETTPGSLYTETWYDALGNAFRSRDVTGNYSYKTYDRMGRVKFDIGARVQGVSASWNQNYVTLHVYDAFGNQTGLTRYANALATQPSISAASLLNSDISVTASTADRTITTAYDRRNLSTSVTQASLANNFWRAAGVGAGSTFTDAAVATTTYNAFGEVVKTSRKISLTASEDSYSYYDRRGYKTADVDALSFLTKYRYDASGDLVEQTEFARQITGTYDIRTFTDAPLTPYTLGIGAAGTDKGFDRTTINTYDRRNRLTLSSQQNVEHAGYNGLILETRFQNVSTSYGYDVLGNQIQVTDALNNPTFTFYDVLGRTVAVIAPPRVVETGSSVRPATRFFRDAHGNVVKQVEYKSDVTGTLVNNVLPTFNDNAEDRVTKMQYDLQGRVIHTEDAVLADRFASYGADGKLSKEWVTVHNLLDPNTSVDDRHEALVTIYKYDAQGQVIETKAPVSLDSGQVIRNTKTVYNAFGEIVTKGTVDALDTNGTQEFFDYDVTGRIWRTNSGDGVTRIVLYDLAGQATVEFRSQTVNLRSFGSLAAFLTVYNTDTTPFMRTETVYSAVGKAIERYTPTYRINNYGLPAVAPDFFVGTLAGSPVAGHVYFYWVGTDSATADELFYYRTGGGVWTAGTVVTLPGGYLGVDVHALRNADYEYQILYRRSYQTTSIAQSNGTFRVNISQTIGIGSITQGTLSDADAIGNLGIVSTAPLALTAGVQSAEWISPAQNAPYMWIGANVLHASFASVGLSSVRVVAQYYKRTQGYPTYGQGAFVSINEVTSTYVNGTEIHHQLPSDASNASDGGVYSLYRVQIYTADGATLLRDSQPNLAPYGLVWAAPTDQTVTAVFRYKRSVDSTFSSDVNATRLGTQFAVNVFPLLNQNTTYDYEVEFRRAGVAIAKKGGQMTSSGEVVNHSYAGTVSSTATDGFNQAVGSPTIAGLSMSWAPPTDNLDPTFETAGIVSTFEWGTSTAYGSSLGITKPGSGNWSVNLAEIPTPPVNTTYYYRTRYTIGGRIVAEQTGNFQISAPATSTNITANNNGPQPTPAPAVASVSGSNGILTAGWSFNPSGGSQTYFTPPVPGGGSVGQWIGANVVGVSWADTGVTQTVRVLLDYVIKTHLGAAAGAASKWSTDLSGGPTGLTAQPMVWQDGNGTSHLVTPLAGIASVLRVRVYKVVGAQLTLIRDSNATGGTAGPPRLTWNAPDPSLNLAARITVNGASTDLTPSGGVYTYSLGSLNGAFSYLIEYFRAGQTPAIVTQSGTVTTDTVSCSVSNISTTNRNPSWIAVSSSGPTLSWSQAPVAAGDVSFRYRVVGTVDWQYDLSPPASGGPAFNVTFPNSSTGVTQYEYEVRYLRPAETLPYVYSTGTVTVVRTNNSSTGTFGSMTGNSVSRMQQVAVDATLTGNLFRWNYLLASGSSVTFRYRVNGGTENSTTFSTGGVSQFEVALAGLPVPSSTVTWSIEYNYPGQAPYAAASGSVAATHSTTTTPATTIAVSTQQNQYPSPIQIAQAMDLGNGYLGWTTPLQGTTTATLRYRIDGGTWQTTTLGFETYGAGLRRQFTQAGAYEYELEYQQSGQPTPYAKTKGTFGVSVADNAPSLMTRTIDTPRSESLFSGGPYIELTPTPVNAGAADQDLVARAIWSRVPNPQADQYIPIVSASPNAYVQTQLASGASPGQYTAVAGITVEYHFQLKWAVNANVDTDMLFEYRVAGSGSTWSTKTVYLLNSGQHLGVDINAFANNTYEFRLSYKHTGAAAPYATASGTFTKTGTLTNPVTLDAPPAIPIEDANPLMKQSLDRWGNILQSQDLAGQLTNFRYDQRNLLVRIMEPTVTYLDTRITVPEAPLPSARPTSYTYYDKLGHVIATRDPNGNETRMTYNTAGQLTSKESADSGAYAGGAFVYNTYNTFGNLVQVTDELGFRTRTKYDGRDQVKEVWREIVANTMPAWTVLTPEATMQRHAYTYDEAGRRIIEVNGENETLRYGYDLAGNLSFKLTPLGGQTKFTFDVHGRKATEIQVLDTAGNIHTRQDWQFDYFGRLQDHIGIRLMNSTDETKWGNDLRTDYGYTYNYAGQLTNQTSSSGLNIAYYFDRAGQLTLIVDSAAKRRTDYTYDSAGRRIRERVTVDNLVHQDTRVTYDSHSRIETAEDPNYRLSYSYDLAGNRTLIRADYVNQAAGRVSDTLYYKYDEMNRVVVSQGMMDPASRNVVITAPAPTYAAQGYKLKYNARGERVEMTQRGGKWTQVGDKWSQPFTNGAEVTEYYKYDGLGRLTKTEIDKAGGGRQTRQEYTLDREGRAKFEWTYSIIIVNAEPDGYLEVRRVDSTYDADGRVSQQINRKKKNTQDDSSYKIETIVRMGTATYADHYGNSALEWSAGYDKAGNLRGYDIERYTTGQQTIGNWHWITHTKFTYDLGESYLQRIESAESYGDESRPGNGSTTRYYDTNETLVAAIDAEAPNKSRAYVSNQGGQVLTTYQGVVAPPPADNRAYWDSAVAYATRASRPSTPITQNYFYINDQAVGSVGALQQNAQAPWRGNFDVNYTPVSSEYPGTQPQFVVVISGDTLRSVATRIYGDGNLWYILADENALSSPDALLTEGMSLRVPNKIISLANSGSVFKPYDHAAAIGDLTPTQPIPPPPGISTCQVFGMFVILIITVIVAYYTGLWIAPKLAAVGITGTMAAATAAAIGAAAGSVVGQGVGMMLGLQDKFDWKQVAMAAATSFVSAGLGGLPGADTLEDGDKFAGIFSKMASSDKFASMTKFFGSVTRVFGDSFQPVVQAGLKAAAVGAITQRLMVAVDLKDKFSWREVAAQSVGAMVGTVAGKGLERFTPKMPQVFKDSLSGFAGGVASAAVKGGKIEYANIAVDAFGNALAGSIIGEVNQSVAEMRQRQHDWGIHVQSTEERLAEIADRAFPSMATILGSGQPMSLGSDRILLASTSPFSPELLTGESERLRQKAIYDLGEGLGDFEDKVGVLNAGSLRHISREVAGNRGYHTVGHWTMDPIAGYLESQGLSGSPSWSATPFGGAIINYSYTPAQLAQAESYIKEVIGVSLDSSNEIPLRLLYARDANSSSDVIYQASVNDIGGYADAYVYKDLQMRSQGLEASHGLMNVSFGFAQSDARATFEAINTSFYKSLDGAQQMAKLGHDLDIETGFSASNYLDNQWGHPALDYEMTMAMLDGWKETSKNISFATDELAPAALRDDARASVFLEAALALPQVVGAGMAAYRGVRTLVSMARLTRFGSVDELAAGLRAVDTVPQQRIFTKGGQWTATRPTGTKQTYDLVKRNDIDWAKVRTDGPAKYVGKTNEEAARAGFAPQLSDDNFATLHHLGQDSRGGLAEASTRYHGVGKPGNNSLHGIYGPNKPHPEFPINRNAFRVDTAEYWKWRVNNP
jgi:YD repeat-containing protein